MNIVERICASRPTESEVCSFERTLNATLPESYRKFLINENGGRPDLNKSFLIGNKGLSEDISVHYFFGLHSGRIGSLEKKLSIFKGRIPTGFVPIGCDPFGNLFLIQISGENHGKIFFWDHERETESPAMDNISFVADSFEAFVENLS